MTDKHLYTEDSIESLSPLEFTRLRPQVYAGDCTYSTQLLVEIISNAVDEYRLGHGNKIDVTIDKDIVTVRDYGQGFIPNSFREDGKTIREAAFSVLNTSGKYRDDGTYEGTSLGSFGIGSKITTFLSHWLTVTTIRDNHFENCRFLEGVFDKRETGICNEITGKTTGTRVSWKPSVSFTIPSSLSKYQFALDWVFAHKNELSYEKYQQYFSYLANYQNHILFDLKSYENLNGSRKLELHLLRLQSRVFCLLFTAAKKIVEMVNHKPVSTTNETMTITSNTF